MKFVILFILFIGAIALDQWHYSQYKTLRSLVAQAALSPPGSVLCTKYEDPNDGFTLNGKLCFVWEQGK